MSTQLNLGRDVQGFNAYAPDFATDNYSATITTGAAAPVTVPSGNFTQWIAVFSYEPGASVWVANGTTATVPAGATFAATQSQLNPAARRVDSGDILSLITADTSSIVGISFYAIK